MDDGLRGSIKEGRGSGAWVELPLLVMGEGLGEAIMEGQLRRQDKMLPVAWSVWVPNMKPHLVVRGLDMKP